jgi:peptidyl-dipeptidase Dcp
LLGALLEQVNPFANRSTLEYELPDFKQIKDEHYLPAFVEGCAQQLAEVEQILQQSEVTFENTLVALEKSGAMLHRMLVVFYNKSSADTNPTIDSIESDIAPKLAAHEDAIKLNPRLFARIQELFEKRSSLGLDSESTNLIERYYRDFVYSGAALDEQQREQLKKYNERLSVLEAKFGQNALAEANRLAVEVSDVERLRGLSESEIATAAAAAKDRGLDGSYLINMVNFSGHPMLADLEDRALREEIMKASLSKSVAGGEFDNRELLLEAVEIRAKRAKLLGFGNHAEYVLSEQTAKKPELAHAMLRQIAPAAIANAKAEALELQRLLNRDEPGAELASWDWAFYTEILRKEKYSLDTALMKPYFELNRVLFDGVFYAATKLFGITFTERKDLIAYHPEARVFEVHNEDGSKLGLFIGDFFTRDSKRGGAWMNNLVDQSFLLDQLPVVVNNLNIPKPQPGEDALLTFDETSTLFHEFGHALHGLFSKVHYPRFSGTEVERDFVEFPSQVNEMWMLWPEVLANYAKHHKTGEAFPAEWIENLKKSETFNQGFETTSYLAAAILDLAWHEVCEGVAEDVEAFEAKAIKNYGLDFEPVPVRYRSAYFSHIFAGGYSAGYYGYIWSEVLDAASVDWFKANGGLARANGDRFRNSLLARGGSVDSMQMYSDFTGQKPDINPLLKRRGLA